MGYWKCGDNREASKGCAKTRAEKFVDIIIACLLGAFYIFCTSCYDIKKFKFNTNVGNIKFLPNSIMHNHNDAG